MKEACLASDMRGKPCLSFRLLRINAARGANVLPIRKISRVRKNTRRSHHALKPRNVVACPKCGQAKLPHAACSNCGYASAKVALTVASEE